MLDIDNIRIDGGTQARVELNESVVADYAEILESGETLPPVVVFFDGVDHWLADGFHRYFAHKKIDAVEISADIHDGTRRDAVLFSVGANKGHGLQANRADKRKATETLLRDAEWSLWSDNAIAKQCGVSNKTVAAHRASILGNSQDAKPKTRTVERNGKIYEQNTANIGKQVAPVAPKEEQAAAIEKPIPRPAPGPQEPEYTDLDAARDQISDLQHEVERLSDRLAVEAIDASEEEKTAASETIAALRTEVKTLTSHLEAVTISRDTLQEENAQLKRQCQMYRNKLDKLGKP